MREIKAAAFSHLSDSDASKSDASKPTRQNQASKNAEPVFTRQKSGILSIQSTDHHKRKPSCPVAPQPDPEVLITDNAILVLTHLNQVSGSRYQKSKTSGKHPCSSA
jgi:hypothetical protein